MEDAADQMTDATAGFAHCVSSTKSQLNWADPALHLYNPKATQSQAYDHIFDTFRLLQTNQSVQVMFAADPSILPSVVYVNILLFVFIICLNV